MTNKLAWSEDQLAKLKSMAEAGASPVRVAAALNRNTASVRVMGRKIGITFKGVREAKRERDAKIAAAQQAEGRVAERF
ncbi:hypothetical protein AB8B21_07500 [Tardiphaga sp. 866_E4_N2_1]|uniref:hypothetical protein n=1 Tax=unclassified Tardiphaga TaxID=2631404 RepID=UPI003F274D40